MTTGISLVRENTEALAPPRALWVTFPLGRPLGKPGDPVFQHQVIAAALDLLNRQSGPVLEDFPLDVPAGEVESSPACPVSFPKKVVDGDTWENQLLAELSLLKPWHDLGRRRRGGRTSMGLSDTPIEEIAVRLGAMLDQGELPVNDLRWFKLAIEDAKAFYTESLMSQPGDYVAEQIQSVLWNETRLGAALTVFYRIFLDTPGLNGMARIVAPRAAVGGSTGECEIEP